MRLAHTLGTMGPRSTRGQQITSPCSLVAPKEAVTSVNSTHEASGTDLWVLGLKETRSDHQTCALWCASMCHSWVENVTHWSYEPPPFVPPGFWCTISAGEERKKWWKRREQRARLGAVLAGLGGLFSENVPRVLLDRAGERKLLNNFIALDYYRDQAVRLQA